MVAIYYAGPLDCPYGYSPILTRCFKLTDALDWFTALSSCQSSGGTLATITSLSENNALFDFVRSKGNFQAVWIGYKREYNGGPFVWVDGSTSTFTNWNSEEPSNGNGVEIVAEMRIVWNGTWNDMSSSYGFPGLCSIKSISKSSYG